MAYTVVAGERTSQPHIRVASGLSKQTPAHLISADREPQPAFSNYSQRIQTMQMHDGASRRSMQMKRRPARHIRILWQLNKQTPRHLISGRQSLVSGRRRRSRRNPTRPFVSDSRSRPARRVSRQSETGVVSIGALQTCG